jgi:hypothetical protein
MAFSVNRAFMPAGKMLGITFGFSLLHIATTIIEDKKLRLLLIFLSFTLTMTSIAPSVYFRLTA